MHHKVNNQWIEVTTEVDHKGHIRYFSAVSTQPIDETTARLLQKMEGYNPAGYDFFDFQSNVEDQGIFHYADWQSLASCD